MRSKEVDPPSLRSERSSNSDGFGRIPRPFFGTGSASDIGEQKIAYGNRLDHSSRSMGAGMMAPTSSRTCSKPIALSLAWTSSAQDLHPRHSSFNPF